MGPLLTRSVLFPALPLSTHTEYLLTILRVAPATDSVPVFPEPVHAIPPDLQAGVEGVPFRFPYLLTSREIILGLCLPPSTWPGLPSEQLQADDRVHAQGLRATAGAPFPNYSTDPPAHYPPATMCAFLQVPAPRDDRASDHLQDPVSSWSRAGLDD